MRRKRIGAILLAFGFSVLLFEALHAALAWWNGTNEDVGWTQWLLLGSLPLLAFVWWRYLSVFGRDRGRCLLPEERPRPAARRGRATSPGEEVARRPGG